MRQNAARPLGPILAVLATLVLALLGPLSPAAAHDVVTGTNPSDGQSLEAAPEAIEVSFSNTPLALGAQILVEDARGTDWTTGQLQIAGNSAAQPLRPDAPAGQYTVTWRVVSSDSHPIEGTFGFTVTGADASASTGPATAPASEQSQTATAAPEPSQAAPAPETGTEPTAAEEPAAGFPVGFVIVLAVILVLALVIVVVAVLARRRAGSAGPQ